MQGFTADPVYAKGKVFAYVGSTQNLKDLKDSPLTSYSEGSGFLLFLRLNKYFKSVCIR